MFQFLKSRRSEPCSTWIAAATRAAHRNSIKPSLFVALIINESSGNALATRWERRFYLRYIAQRPIDQLTRNTVRDLDTYEEQTFRHCLAYSWGLCQIMGVVAYENGFRGKNCWELLDVETNVNLGAEIFARKYGAVKKADPGATESDLERRALLAYNGGADEEYPARVYNRLKTAEELIKQCA